MLKFRIKPKLLCLALLLSLGPPVALARPDGHGLQLAQNSHGKGKPLSETVDQYGRQKRNRVLSAEPKKQNGRELHSIRVLTDDGRVKTILIDPETGREIRR
ncbi:MAG: hypothetical protein J4A00_00480 [Gammaproteobacteria bacterium]|nr:hypothetical protein [Gammaproteobacteria bacterium]